MPHAPQVPQVPHVPQALQMPQAPQVPQVPHVPQAPAAGAACPLTGRSWPECSEGHERSPAGVYMYVFDHPGKATVKCVYTYIIGLIC